MHSTAFFLLKWTATPARNITQRPVTGLELTTERSVGKCGNAYANKNSTGQVSKPHLVHFKGFLVLSQKTSCPNTETSN